MVINKYWLITIVVLYIGLLISVYFYSKQVGYNDGLSHNLEVMDEIREDLERITNLPILIPDHPNSI